MSYENDHISVEDNIKKISKKLGIEYLMPDYYINNNTQKVEIIVDKNNRITSDVMTIFEYTRVISERAKQIENGSIIFIDIGNETNPKEIAVKEIQQKKSPYRIKRCIDNQGLIFEIWDVNEMIIPFH